MLSGPLSNQQKQKALKNLNEDEKDDIEEQLDMNLAKRELGIKKYIKAQKGKALILNQCEIDDLDAYTVAHILAEKRQNYSIIDLSKNYLTDEGFSNLIVGIQLHTNLQELYLSNNVDIGPISIQSLIQCFNVLPNLNTLFLNNCQIDSDTMIELCMSLPNIPKLKTLSVMHNYIGDEGLLCLSVLFQTGQLKYLSNLQLGYNEFINPLGIQGFLETLYNIKQLKILNLSGLENCIGKSEKSLKIIQNLLENNQKIQELNLSNCKISDKGLEYIIQGIQKNYGLQNLHLFNNKITDSGLQKLLQMAKDGNIHVQHLSLFGNRIQKTQQINDLQNELNPNFYSSQPKKFKFQCQDELDELGLKSEEEDYYEKQDLEKSEESDQNNSETDEQIQEKLHKYKEDNFKIEEEEEEEEEKKEFETENQGQSSDQSDQIEENIAENIQNQSEENSNSQESDQENQDFDDSLDNYINNKQKEKQKNNFDTESEKSNNSDEQMEQDLNNLENYYEQQLESYENKYNNTTTNQNTQNVKKINNFMDSNLQQNNKTTQQQQNQQKQGIKRPGSAKKPPIQSQYTQQQMKMLQGNQKEGFFPYLKKKSLNSKK